MPPQFPKFPPWTNASEDNCGGREEWGVHSAIKQALPGVPLVFSAVGHRHSAELMIGLQLSCVTEIPGFGNVADSNCSVRQYGTAFHI